MLLQVLRINQAALESDDSFKEMNHADNNRMRAENDAEESDGDDFNIDCLLRNQNVTKTPQKRE